MLIALYCNDKYLQKVIIHEVAYSDNPKEVQTVYYRIRYSQ